MRERERGHGKEWRGEKRSAARRENGMRTTRGREGGREIEYDAAMMRTRMMRLR